MGLKVTAFAVTFSDSYVTLHVLPKGDPHKFRERERENVTLHLLSEGDPHKFRERKTHTQIQMDACVTVEHITRIWNLIFMYMCVYIRCVRLAT